MTVTMVVMPVVMAGAVTMPVIVLVRVLVIVVVVLVLAVRPVDMIGVVMMVFVSVCMIMMVVLMPVVMLVQLSLHLTSFLPHGHGPDRHEDQNPNASDEQGDAELLDQDVGGHPVQVHPHGHKPHRPDDEECEQLLGKIILQVFVTMAVAVAVIVVVCHDPVSETGLRPAVKPRASPTSGSSDR